jgi:proline dehydrogenase
MFELANEQVYFKSSEPGDVTSEMYEGVFEVRKVLTPAQKSMADFERRAFLGNPGSNEDIDREVAELAFAIGQLKVRVVKGPKWFSESNGLKTFLDQNILIELTKQVLEVELKFKTDLKAKADKAKQNLMQK